MRKINIFGKTISVVSALILTAILSGIGISAWVLTISDTQVYSAGDSIVSGYSMTTDFTGGTIIFAQNGYPDTDIRTIIVNNPEDITGYDMYVLYRFEDSDVGDSCVPELPNGDYLMTPSMSKTTCDGACSIPPYDENNGTSFYIGFSNTIPDQTAITFTASSPYSSPCPSDLTLDVLVSDYI